MLWDFSTKVITFTTVGQNSRPEEFLSSVPLALFRTQLNVGLFEGQTIQSCSIYIHSHCHLGFLFSIGLLFLAELHAAQIIKHGGEIIPCDFWSRGNVFFLFKLYSISSGIRCHSAKSHVHTEYSILVLQSPQKVWII